jgi:endonuclease/exonuclease/phosphatase family metal-dependent hydrolase
MRLLSYNIHKGVGGMDRRYRLERVMDVIASVQPDLVLLQEVTRHAKKFRNDDQGALLAERFDAAVHLHQVNVHYRQGGYGNLLLSRWPLLSKHQVSLRMQARKPRGAQLAVINTPHGPLHLVHSHLGLAERERHWQVRRLLEHPLFADGAPLPTIVAGDFNDWRNTLAAGPFAAHGFQQITSPVLRFRSFPAFAPLGSLDKAFHRGGVLVKNAHIVRSKIAKRASDHLPLLIDFDVHHGDNEPPK